MSCHGLLRVGSASCDSYDELIADGISVDD